MISSFETKRVKCTKSLKPSEPSSLEANEAAAALLNLQKLPDSVSASMTSFRDPLAVPDKCYCNSKTGRMHGLLKVQRKWNVVGFDYFLEDQLGETGRPLLVANHRPSDKRLSFLKTPAGWMVEKRHYLISHDVHNGAREKDAVEMVLGEVSLSPSLKHVVAFTVTLLEQLDSCIFYKVHSMEEVTAKDGTCPARQAEYVRLTEHAKRVSAKVGFQSVAKTTESPVNPFFQQISLECSELLQQPAGPMTNAKQDTGAPRGRSPKLLCDPNFVSIFHSKRPTLNKSAGQAALPTLNFQGRGKILSNKNMQLINEDGIVCLQVAKVDSETYHVDFSAPFSPFHAFAFGIAQIIL